MENVDNQHLGMIARHRTSVDSLYQPFRYQAFRKFALRILKAENGPASSGIEQALQLVLIRPGRVHAHRRPSHAPIEPKSGAHAQRAPTALGIEGEQKMQRLDEVRVLPQQASSLT